MFSSAYSRARAGAWQARRRPPAQWTLEGRSTKLSASPTRPRREIHAPACAHKKQHVLYRSARPRTSARAPSHAQRRGQIAREQRRRRSRALSRACFSLTRTHTCVPASWNVCAAAAGDSGDGGAQHAAAPHQPGAPTERAERDRKSGKRWRGRDR